jgi:hypothetical protein
MPDDTTLSFGVDAGDALDALAAVKQAVTAIAAPAAQLKSAFADAGAAVESFGSGATAQMRANAAAIALFKSSLQEMVDSHRLSLQQALGFDIDYTAQLAAQDRARIEDARGRRRDDRRQGRALWRTRRSQRPLCERGRRRPAEARRRR